MSTKESAVTWIGKPIVDPVIRPHHIAKAMDVTVETVHRWRKARPSKLPPCDVVLSRETMGWRRSTLVAAGIDIPLPGEKEPVGIPQAA